MTPKPTQSAPPDDYLSTSTIDINKTIDYCSNATSINRGTMTSQGKRRAYPLIAAVVGLLLPLTVLTTPGGADEPPDKPPSTTGQVAEDPDIPDGARLLSDEEAQFEDAQEIASSDDRSSEVVLEDLKFQENVTDLIGSLSEDMTKESYGSARLSFSPDREAVLYFRNAVPEEARTALRNADISRGTVTLQGGMDFSMQQLIARQRIVHDALIDLGFKELATGLDVPSQTIEIEVARQPDRPNLRGSELRDRLVERANEREPGLNTAIRPADFSITGYPAGTRLTTRPSHSYGGAWLLDDGARECTSGFTVRRSSDGLEGTLTAAHCEGLNQMEENNTSGGANVVFSAPFADEHIGTYGDVEWHTTTHDDFPEFWSTTSSRRTVKDRIANSQISQGDYVCHYGRNTRYSCGNVSDVNSTATFVWEYTGETVTAYNMVDVEGADDGPGDSGGPWFNSSTAWGIHHGERISNGDEVFSKIQNAETAFGVNVEFG